MSRRCFIVLALIAGLGAVGSPITGCSRSKSFKLPDIREADLAFGALYDTGDRVVALGPIVTRQRLSAGGYSIEYPSDGLLARLFLVQGSALAEAAQEGCAAKETRAEERACTDLITSCAETPLPCLAVFPAGEQCGARLELPRTLRWSAFESAGGDLKPASDPAALADTLVFCGPVIEQSCPNMLPGYAITEGGAFRCSGLARQIGCAIEVDLADCGLSLAEGVLAADGAFSGELTTSACTITALDPTDQPLGDRAGAFAIICGKRRFIASPMEQLFGEALCTRRGPPVFNEASSFLGEGYRHYGTGHGRVTGMKSIRPSGWSARYLFSGTGHDDCAVIACGLNGIGCVDECHRSCVEQVQMPDCAGANPWSPCTGTNGRTECETRCTEVCDENPDSCYQDAIGHALALSSPDAPETTARVFNLDLPAAAELGATGSNAIALLGDRSAPRVVIAHEAGVRLYSARDPDTLVESVPARTPLAFRVAGVAAHPQRTDEVFVFGTSLATGRGVLAHLRATDETDPRLVEVTPQMESLLPTIDAAAPAGPDGNLIVAASLAPPLGATGAGRLHVLAAAGGVAPNPAELPIPGRATAIAALPGGVVAAAIELSSDASNQLLLYTTASGSVDLVATLPLAGDLEITAIAEDPMSCSMEDRCRVYLGYRQRGPNRDHGTALVGLLQLDRASPNMSRIVPSFVKTSVEELSILEVDTVRGELVAVGAARNQLTPIELVR